MKLEILKGCHVLGGVYDSNFTCNVNCFVDRDDITESLLPLFFYCNDMQKKVYNSFF